MIQRRIMKKCLAVTCVSFAIVILACGIAITFVFDYVFREQLAELMPLRNGSMSYMGWNRSTPGALTISFWLWNVTNPDEIVKGLTPKLKEIGPFTFMQERYRADVQFFPNNTVGSRVKKAYYYAPDLSYKDGNMSKVTITSVNMAYLVTAAKTMYMKEVYKNLIDKYFRQVESGLFITKSAKEILLGYEDKALKSIAPIVQYTVGMKVQTKVGLFYGQNNTAGGYFLVHSGENNLTMFNKILSYENRTNLGIWPENWANELQGTDGTMFPPMVEKSNRLQIFSSDICRSLELEFTGESSVHGIDVYQYSPPEDIMANATVNPRNKAFCTPNCMDSGVMNISECRDGVPLAISSPHFLGAADRYINAIQGVNPHQKYETVINVEPNTGFVVKAGRMMQMNAIIENNTGYKDLENITNMLLLPIMWLNESGGIDAVNAGRFRVMLLQPIKIVNYGQWVLIGIGIVLLLTVVICIYQVGCLKHRDHELNTEETSIDISNKYNNSFLTVPLKTEDTIREDSCNSDYKSLRIFTSDDNLSNEVNSELMNKLLSNALRESDIF